MDAQPRVSGGQADHRGRRLTLHVVGTPLGNAADLSPRAREVLGRVDCVYCEDTRTTGRLLDYVGVQAKALRSLHAHNERDRIDEILSRLERGEEIALASDAGMPGVSDPGGQVVAAVHESGLRVASVPGPCAVSALMSVAGLPSRTFTFVGFLPKAPGPRRRALASHMRPGDALVLYVPARDLPATLDDVAALRPDAIVALGRELTKLHEEIVRSGPAELAEALRGRDRLLGEATLAVAIPSECGDSIGADQAERVRRAAEILEGEGVHPARIRETIAALTDLKKNPIRRLLDARDSE